MGEGVGGADGAAAGDDFAHWRKHLLGLRVEEVTDGEVALGDPGAAIEQARGFEEGREVDFHRRAAERLHAFHRFAEQALCFGIAEELQILLHRHAEAETGRAAEVEAVRRQRARVLIVGIETGCHRQHALGIFGGEREDRHRIERTAGGHHAAGGQRAAARLVADEVVERGGHAPGAGGVGAERETRQAQRHRHRRTGAGTAGDVIRVEGVAAGAVGRAGAVEAGGELVQIGLAERDGAGVDQALHDGGVSLGHVGKLGTAGRGGQAGEVDVVLDGEGDAVERQPGDVLAFQPAGVGTQFMGVEAADPDAVGVFAGHAREEVFHQGERSEFARLIPASQGSDVE